MARLNAVDTATASSKITELFGQVEKKLGRVPNMMRTMAVSPTVLEAYLSFSGALAGGALPPRLREQIALTVGEANRCEYCLSAHTAIGKRLGLTEDEVAASREAAAGDPKAQTALRFARALVERRGEVTDAELARVREAGWSDGELAEIIAHVALNVFTNYFNIAAGTDIDFPRVPVGAARG